MVGKNLSHYKILEELGRGGMGIVYKGEDTKLQRTVAIKVLPASALSNEDDRARFYREARAAASLTHPNIAVIHEIDEAVPEGAKDDDLRPFIAMEFIEGETLEARIKKAPLKLDEAVRIASEIADGLKAAHAKDIVHRDIKAANVMLDVDGRAKILDFGLALTAQSTKLTRMGSTLGTVAYMSPEQARGEEVDGRTDIWALGVTLYEMVAGRHPFGGDYEQAVVYSILNEDPEPLTAVRTGVPMGLEWIVTKMMAKKAEHRYQSVAEALVDLQTVDLTQTGMSRMSTKSTMSQRPVAGRSRIIGMLRKNGVAVLLTALTVFGLTWLMTRPDLEEQPIIEQPLIIPGAPQAEDIDVSPDGTRMVFQGVDLDGGTATFEWDRTPGGQTIRLTDGGSEPAYSPNGRFILVRKQIMERIPTGGGTPHKIPGSDALARSSTPNWLDDQHFIMSDKDGNVVRVRVSDGSREVLIRPDSSEGQATIRTSHLDRSRRYLTVTIVSRVPGAPLSVGIADLKKKEVHVIAEGASYPYFVAEDIVMYTRHNSDFNLSAGIQFVQRISKDRTRPEGSPVSVPSGSEKPGYAFHVRQNDFGLWTNNSSDFTTNVLYKQDLNPGGQRVKIRTISSGGAPALSPQSTVIARVLGSIGWGAAVEMMDLSDTTSSIQYPADSIWIAQPVWGKDGNSLFLTQKRNGMVELVEYPLDFSSPSRPVIPNAVALDTSPDGKWLAYATATLDGSDLKLKYQGLFLYDLSLGEHISMDRDSLDIWHASFRSGSDYLAITVQDATQAKIQTRSIHGGVWQDVGIGHRAVWSPDDAYLYYQDGDSFVRKSVTGQSTPRFGAKEKMFGVWFNRGAAFDFKQNIAYTLALLDVEPNQDASITWVSNFPAYARQLLEGEK